jgi:hypothetical protein
MGTSFFKKKLKKKKNHFIFKNKRTNKNLRMAWEIILHNHHTQSILPLLMLLLKKTCWKILNNVGTLSLNPSNGTHMYATCVM